MQVRIGSRSEPCSFQPGPAKPHSDRRSTEIPTSGDERLGGDFRLARWTSLRFPPSGDCGAATAIIGGLGRRSTLPDHRARRAGTARGSGNAPRGDDCQIVGVFRHSKRTVRKRRHLALARFACTINARVTLIRTIQPRGLQCLLQPNITNCPVDCGRTVRKRLI